MPTAADKSYSVIYRNASSINQPDARYRGFREGRVTVLRGGSQYQRGALPLPCDIVKESDVALEMRDGVTIYADIYRPDTSQPVPAVVNWAPYGKGDTGYWVLDNKKMFPNRFGIHRSRLSGLQSWEGNDPAYWCAHGYAVVQVDSRGAFNSAGDVHYLSSAEGRDGHDAVEAIAALPWCSGKVGLAGNSWLAMSQWRTASERPDHLAAIAPWEGLTDLYREVLARGGVPRTGFPAFIRDKIYGHGKVEDPVAMLEKHPLVDEYWEDKLPDVARIDVPAYVVGSYTNPVHVNGTLQNWDMLTSPKWLRIHNSQEWPDFYDPRSVEDLRRFFDRYLKEIDNGWEATPRVRMAVLDPGHVDTVDQSEDTFPPSRVHMTDFHLDAGTRTLQLARVVPEHNAEYRLDEPEPHVDFTYRFDTDTEVIGYPMLTVWASVEGHDDADLFVQVQKLDEKGRQLWHQTVTLGFPLARRWMPIAHQRGVKSVAPAFYDGPHGVLRLSRRGLDESSKPSRPKLSLRQERRLAPGEPVEAQIPLWPTAMRWRAGEQMRLRISGTVMLPPVLPGLVEEPRQPGDRHVIHTGGRYPARLTLPVTPA
ncbi:CocE/NonD family hydrolase [Rhodococcus opacus]|uniref:CocE/NonD family hydrolase n=1 Tax=Rhodococcus opacus TaxID=37919 RepID=UPI001C48ECC6|nr:CocE/NonD family hydrolase [Rhodococcus opacus]MBV6760421.1 CocE/NonD family hydrolase [Rhodococcus opacus]